MSRASDPDWDGVRAYNSPNAVSERLECEATALRAEIASLRAQNELTHTSYVEENNRLMAEREALRAELALAKGQCQTECSLKELTVAENKDLHAELAAAKRELNDAEEARNDAETRLLANLTAARQDAEEPTKYMLWAEIRLRDGKIRQDAEEKARLRSELTREVELRHEALEATARQSDEIVRLTAVLKKTVCTVFGNGMVICPAPIQTESGGTGIGTGIGTGALGLKDTGDASVSVGRVQRRYTLDEIDQMRQAIHDIEWRSLTPSCGTNTCYSMPSEAEVRAMIEDKLRTHMLNGTDPEELRKKATDGR